MKLTLSLVEAYEIIRKHTNAASDVVIEILLPNGNILEKSLTDGQLRGINDVEDYLRKSNKIGAIKEYRAMSGVGLWEAKSVVENWDRAKKIIEMGRLVTARRSGLGEFGRDGIEIVALP